MEDNKLDNISKKLFENIELEKPSRDFTEKLMLKLENVKVSETAKSRPFYKNNFMIVFFLTFGIISVLGFFFGRSTDNSKIQSVTDKVQLPTFDLSIFTKYLHVSFDFGFLVKLIVASIVILIVFDLISGNLIDRFIDSRARKENKA